MLKGLPKPQCPSDPSPTSSLQTKCRSSACPSQLLPLTPGDQLSACALRMRLRDGISAAHALLALGNLGGHSWRHATDWHTGLPHRSSELYTWIRGTCLSLLWNRGKALDTTCFWRLFTHLWWLKLWSHISGLKSKKLKKSNLSPAKVRTAGCTGCSIQNLAQEVGLECITLQQS